MFHSLDQIFRHSARWPVILLFVLANLGCAAAFYWRGLQLKHEAPDSRKHWYSAKDVRDFLDAIGPDGRQLYAATQVTLDFLYPLTYGVIFGWLLIAAYPAPRGAWVVWLPVVTVLCDYGENVTTAYLAWTFDGNESPLATGAAACTVGKWSLVGVTCVAIVVGGIWRGVEYWMAD